MLVTPIEKLEIEVESTAFRAIAMHSEGRGTARRVGMTLDSGDALIVGTDHPFAIVGTAESPSPRLLVRHGLEAELARPVYYELAELALAEASDPPGFWSEGQFFSLAVEE
jgi:hypothetical protein